MHFHTFQNNLIFKDGLVSQLGILINNLAPIDVPRPLTNGLWVFLFQTIEAECVKWACLDGTYVYVKAFII